MNPAEVLRAAADRIDQLAAATTPGPWRTADVEGIFYIASANHGPVTMDNDGPVCTCSGPDENGGVAIERDESEGGRGDADWMVALGPQVAPQLSAWLRAEADAHQRREALMLVGGGAATAHALAFARSLLGETGEQP